MLTRARSVIVAGRVEPRVQMDAFPREKTDQGSFTPPFPPSNGRAWGGMAPPPSALYVDSVWEEMRIKRGSRPLFTRPMADQGVVWPRLQLRFNPYFCIHAPPPVYKRGEHRAARGLVWSVCLAWWSRVVNSGIGRSYRSGLVLSGRVVW